MRHPGSLRLLGALFALTLTLIVSAASPVAAGASASLPGKPSTPTARGGAGGLSLPAGTSACRSTQAKPSTSLAACSTAAPSAASSKETVALPNGAAACPSSATKPSSAAATCARINRTSGAAAPLVAFTVSLAASPATLAPGADTALTATANQDVGPTPWFIEIFDSTTGVFEAECGSGTSCATLVARSASTVENFVAYVSSFGTTSPPPNIQATSSTVRVSWLSVTLDATSTILRPGGTTTFTATASLDVGPTPWFIEIFDLTAGTLVVECGFGTTCAISVTQGSAVRTYVAYVSGFGSTVPPPDIRSQTPAILVSWILVGLTASPGSLTAGDATTLAATSSLDVNRTPFWIEIFDESLNTLVVACAGGTVCSSSVSQPAPTIHSYVAFVSGFGTTLAPPNVRAISDPLEVRWVAAPTVTVPSLIGDTPQDASDTLQAAGLVGSAGSDVNCSSLGLVDHQTPVAGTVAAPGSTVSFTVGREPDPPMVCQ